MTSGLLLGGFGVDRIGKTDRRWYVWGPAIALAISTPLMAAGVAQPTVTLAVAVLIGGHIALFVYWTPTLALAMNMVAPTCAPPRRSWSTSCSVGRHRTRPDARRRLQRFLRAPALRR